MVISALHPCRVAKSL